MRAYGLTLTALFLLAPFAAAQPPMNNNPIIPIPGANNATVKPVGGQPGAVPPVLDPQKNSLDRHLLNWEERMKSVESIITKLDRMEKSKDGTTRILKGEARYLKPNYFAVQMIRQDNPNLFEMFIGSGTMVYEYRAQTKEIWWRKLEASEVQVQNNILSIMFLGMNAATAKQRYELQVTKEDENYIYLAIQPKEARDQREFKNAQMVLLAKTMLPRRLWFEHVNGDEVTWDVNSMDTTTRLQAKDFSPPMPQGWTPKPVDTPKPTAPMDTTPPRVIRQNGK